ncbi:MAG: hypothetical protein JO216_13900 [Hyphomicrobiales bacterium]|nr:hypothetical protein [Hyphomicrobiales bacterium]
MTKHAMLVRAAHELGKAAKAVQRAEQYLSEAAIVLPNHCSAKQLFLELKELRHLTMHEAMRWEISARVPSGGGSH